MKKTALALAVLAACICCLAPRAGAASAISLPVSASAPYAAQISDRACTSETFQGSIPLLNTLRIDSIPDACIGKQIVIYTFGASLSSTPAYVGVITGRSVSFPISSVLSLSILGVNASVDGWNAKVNWLGSLY